MSIATGLEDLDWVAAAGALRDTGWFRFPSALTSEACHRLIDGAPTEWDLAPPEEGIVRQHAYVAFLPFDDTTGIVRQVGEQITSSLAAADAHLPPLPTFNMVTWSRYPQGSGFISPHRDPEGIGGVIATVTLAGSAPFRLWERPTGRLHEVVASDEDRSTEWRTEPGDVVLLRGRDWPTDAARCPVHAVDPPPDGDRTIVTYRANAHGAYGDYLADEA